MNTVKRKITVPFLSMIILIPLLTMIVFNIVMAIYTSQIAKRELTVTMDGVEKIVRQQIIKQNANTPMNQAIIKENLKSIRTTLKLSKLFMNTEFVLIKKNDSIVFPKTFEDSFLTEEIMKSLITELSNTTEETIVKFQEGQNSYYACYKLLKGNFANAKLVFISSGSSASGIIRFINIILVIILFVATLTASYLAHKVAKGISNPIRALANHAKRIGEGEFMIISQTENTKEVYELTQSINDMSTRLQAYDSAQKAFLQNASHELRTPLMSIQGYAEGIARGIFTDTTKTAEIICQESKRLNTLVEELLVLSRIENKTYSEEKTTYLLSDILKEYIQKINGYALKEHKTIILSVCDTHAMVQINEPLLAQAVINILSNSIKYAKETIHVTVASIETHAILSIADDGLGISSFDLPHIFDRFYKGKDGNFGLGLSIAKSAIEYMGGSLIAYNKAGAVFEIRLPLMS